MTQGGKLGEIRQISDRPIVSNAPRQAIATESGLQSGFYSTSLLIRTSFQSDRIARVIVKHGQRMQSALPHRYVALEVHLPQIIGPGMLKAHEVLLAAAEAADREAMPTQDGGDGRWRRRDKAGTPQHRGDLAPTPGGMFAANGKNRRLDLRIRLDRRAMRPARMLRQPLIAVLAKPPQPLITRSQAHAEASAQFRHVHPSTHRQSHKLSLQRLRRSY